MRRLLVAAVTIGISSLVPSTVEAKHSLSACGHTSSFRDIPCLEVDRALSESAREFKIEESKFRRVARCESGFNPFNSASYWGLFQHHKKYWAGRVNNFNKSNDPNVLGNPESPFDNARIAAWMIKNEGWGPWPNC